MKRFAALAMCLVFCLFFVGCKDKKGEELKFVTSFYPMYIIALNLTDGVDGVKVENMAQQHVGCLHDFQLQSGDMKKIEESSAFIINGAGMESFMDKVINEMPNMHVIDSSKNIEIIDVDGEENAHIWVSVTNYIKQVENISEGLADTDPKNAAMYKANAVTYIKKLEKLRTKMHQGIDGVENRAIITFHEAFPYFAEEFDLNIAAVINREPESEPSVKELADTIQIVKDTGAKALFVEPQYPDTSAKTIAEETGAKIYTLNPAVSGEDDKDSYIKTMEKNLSVLEEALK